MLENTGPSFQARWWLLGEAQAKAKRKFGQIWLWEPFLTEFPMSDTTHQVCLRRSCLMKQSRGKDFINEITVKMKVIEILEARAESLSVKEVVGLLKLSKSLVYGMIATGELPATRYHRRIRLDPNHVMELVKQQTWQPPLAMSPTKDKAAPGLARGLERAG